MQAFGLALVATTLGVSDLPLDTAIEMTSLKLLAIARRHGVFEPQIQADGLFGCDTLLSLIGYRQAEPPIPDGVLCKTTRLPGLALQ
jgi:hypothetical protein